jgi:Protein of unknown function (DUF3606)
MDDKSKRDYRDRDRINIHEHYEVEYWSGVFGITHDRLKELVKQYGPMVRDIRKALGLPEHEHGRHDRPPQPHRQHG